MKVIMTFEAFGLAFRLDCSDIDSRSLNDFILQRFYNDSISAGIQYHHLQNAEQMFLLLFIMVIASK